MWQLMTGFTILAVVGKAPFLQPPTLWWEQGMTAGLLFELLANDQAEEGLLQELVILRWWRRSTPLRTYHPCKSQRH